MQIFILLCCELLLIVFAGYLIYSWLKKTPFYPSSPKKLENLINSGHIKINGKNFIDVGSGDGRFVVWAASNGYYAEGIEFNPFLTLASRFKLFVRRLKNAKIYNKDFNNHDFSKYDVVYLYIFPEHMDKIKDKLFEELKPKSVIIASTFKFSGIDPDDVFDKFSIYYIK